MTMTTPNPNATDNPLSDLLSNAAEEMDLPAGLRAAAKGVYDRAGKYLTEHLDDSADWQIYPQGSVRLGTVVKPTGKNDYDLDAVVRWNKTKDQLTQAELKAIVGGVIEDFAEADKTQTNAPTACDEGGRCWTISYDGFHIDWLPSLPDPENRPTGILLTDRKLTRWQFGDPIAYATWFRASIWEQIQFRKSVLAREANVDIEKIDDDDVRTTLHRLVQVLKIHRNEMFGRDAKLQPASIIVTTLAALTYNGGNLIDALSDAADNMASHIETTAGGWGLENPVQAKENFADRWTDAHHAAFERWIRQLQRDVDDLDRVTGGMQNVIIRLGESFGRETMTKAAERYGLSFKNAVGAGALGVTATGALTQTKPALVVPKHTFHGGPKPHTGA